MVETKAHKDAFNQYYLMGADRSLRELARLRNVSEKSPKRWSKAFNWQERITLKDIDLSRKIEEKVDDAVVNTKADFRRDIRLSMQPVKAAINSAVIKDKKTGEASLTFKVENAKDLKAVIDSLEKLIKVDLLVMGEADGRQEVSGSVNITQAIMDGNYYKES